MENNFFLNRTLWFFGSIFNLQTYTELKPLPDTGFRGQFKIFKSLAPWLLIFAVILGNGGISVGTVILILCL